jgi:hypothetical protein
VVNAERGVDLAGHEFQCVLDEAAIVVRSWVALGTNDVLDIAPTAGEPAVPRLG